LFKVLDSTPDIPSDNPKIIHRQLTSIGRFTMRSQTKEHPSIICFFVSLAHEEGNLLDIRDFRRAWKKRVIDQHERFHSRVCSTDDRYFEVVDQSLEECIIEAKHPTKENMPSIIENRILSQMDVTKTLWEIQLSSGPLGSSGCIPDVYIDPKENLERETVAIFRVHHSLGDGISMAVAVGDLCDEGKTLRDEMEGEYRKHMHQDDDMVFIFSFILSLFKTLLYMIWFMFASAYALMRQFIRMVSSQNPFEQVLTLSELDYGRSIAWRPVASLDEMKKTVKRVHHKGTLNDLSVAMTSHAVMMQLHEHAKDKPVRIPKYVNISIPVHLNGGLLPPGEQIGNKIGGLCASIPFTLDNQPRKRLKVISNILRREKMTPQPILSYIMCRFFSDFAPDWLTKWSLRKFSANSVAVISNVRGWPFATHWLGKRVKFLTAFMPLPPGVPIGVMVQSYAGDISFSINADKRVVPDAEKFADWMLEEYKRLASE
jgi:hypothetical protein